MCAAFGEVPTEFGLHSVGVGTPQLVHEGTVPRPRLSDRLRASDVPLVTITAPPGYGKTTLLSEWAERDPRPFAWVTLDSRHEDPVLLVSSLVQAISQVGEVDQRLLATLNSPHPNIREVVLPRLKESMESFDERFVLVLDDVGEVAGPAPREVLAALITSIRCGSTLAMAGRFPMPVPMGRLRGHRAVVELGRRDLAMDAAEGEALLVAEGMELGRDELATVFERTEGWPVALYLASLSIKEGGRVEEAVAGFAGDDFVMAEYLRDEFLTGMSEEQRRFLTDTSILDGLTGDLCDEVLRRTGSRGLLTELARANSMLVWLDRRGEWFRLHRLMGEMLLGDLRRERPEDEAMLHARAAEWFDRHGDTERAIGHAIAAGEVQRAGDLIWKAIPEYIGRGRNATVQAWLDSFGGEQVASSVTLSLASAHAAMARGDGDRAEYWVVTASAGLGRRNGTIGRNLEAGVAITRAMVGMDGVRQMGIDADRGERLVPPNSPWRTICAYVKGVSSHLTGERERAEEELREGTRIASVVAPSLQALCLAQLALIRAEAGEFREAEAEAGHAERQVERAGLTEYGSMALVFAASAAIKAGLGRRDEALRSLRHSLKLLGQVSGFAPWYEAATRIVLGFAYRQLDERKAALDLLRDAEPYLGRCRDAYVLRARYEDCRGAIAAEPPAEADRSGLTPAEARVLGYLPTHLTVGQIADRLFVSANTVKSQSRSIYRKLGVGSRTEAVDMARSRGLLERAGSPPRNIP